MDQPLACLTLVEYAVALGQTNEQGSAKSEQAELVVVHQPEHYLETVLVCGAESEQVAEDERLKLVSAGPGSGRSADVAGQSAADVVGAAFLVVVAVGTGVGNAGVVVGTADSVEGNAGQESLGTVVLGGAETASVGTVPAGGAAGNQVEERSQQAELVADWFERASS